MKKFIKKEGERVPILTRERIEDHPGVIHIQLPEATLRSVKHAEELNLVTYQHKTHAVMVNLFEFQSTPNNIEDILRGFVACSIYLDREDYDTAWVSRSDFEVSYGDIALNDSIVPAVIGRARGCWVRKEDLVYYPRGTVLP